MVRSMTGYGKGEAKGKFGRFTVEVRTVNHRYFDVSSRMPNSLALLEDRVKSYIHKYIKRGKVNFSLIHRLGEEKVATVKVDEDKVARYYKLLNRVKRRFKLKDEVALSHILSFPDVIKEEQPEYDPNTLWPLLEEATRLAILDCNRMRKREGSVLYKDFSSRIYKIRGYVDKIAKEAPSMVHSYRERLHSRIKDLVESQDVDRGRLETEIAIFARQVDVTEEITRARSHLEGMKKTLGSNGEAGRRLDFLLQELQREINTLGQKANDIKISHLVIEVKSEIEKMREQAQNVE